MFKLFKKTKKETILKDTMFENCSTLTMDRFKECHINSNFEKLIKDESVIVTKEQLTERWESIYDEHCQILDTPSYKFLCENKTNELKYINIRHLILTAVFGLEKDCNNEIHKQALRDILRSNYKFNSENKEEFYGELKNCLAKSELFLMKLKKNEKEYEDFLKTQQNIKIEKDYYDLLLAKINAYRGGKDIHLNEITVTEFDSYLKLIELTNGK